MAKKRGEVLVQITQVKKPIDPTEQVIGGNVIVEVERVEQLLLPAMPLSHHFHYSRSRAVASA